MRAIGRYRDAHWAGWAHILCSCWTVPPRSNPAPWLKPTSRSGAPSIAWSVPHCRTITGVSPVSAFLPEENWSSRSAQEDAPAAYCPPQPSFPDACSPHSVSTTLILVVCDRMQNSSCAPPFLMVQTSRTSLCHPPRKRCPP